MVKLMSASVSLSSSAPGNLLPLKALCTGHLVAVVFAASSDTEFSIGNEAAAIIASELCVSLVVVGDRMGLLKLEPR